MEKFSDETGDMKVSSTPDFNILHVKFDYKRLLSIYTFVAK